MPDPKPVEREILVHPNYDLAIRDLVALWPFHTYVDILIVVDTQISTDPANDFGIASVIQEIRNSHIGCMRFRVDIALRSAGAQSVNAAPAPTQPKYVGFRFDMVAGGAPVIDKYEQIWCFGFRPSNSGNASDAEIDLASSLPASNAELNKLDEWMTTRKGGLFGTGDHHFLGASMCRKIPRLGTMRRWTNADGVPPIGGAAQANTAQRIDTLRPPSPAFEPGAPNQQTMFNDPHQGDLKVQPIRWVAEQTHFHTLFVRHKRPHPVLCHPTLGPIDVMPDHAHEGLCVPSPDLAANKKFKAEKEYPNATDGGVQPAPKIIAFGSNLSQPPYLFGKGVQPARSNNPMIAVYDGHRAGVGRVATDSTWHHWMDVNINVIRAADTTDWKKIKRYYQNLAVWLNPPGYSTHCFYLSVIASHFQTVGLQEYSLAATTLELGTALRQHFHWHYGPCWVSERVWDVLVDQRFIPKRFPIPELEEKFPELIIDGELLETLMLGELVKATMEPAQQVRQAADGERGAKVKPLAAPEDLFAKPIRAALDSFVAESKRRCGDANGVIGRLFG